MYFLVCFFLNYCNSYFFSGAQKPKTQIQPQQMIRPPFYLNQQQLQTLQYLQQLNPLNPQQQQLLHQLQHQFRMMQQHQHQQRQQQVRNNSEIVWGNNMVVYYVRKLFFEK